jgi:ribosome-binding protein aMBF1 (putative translation factor)
MPMLKQQPPVPLQLQRAAVDPAPHLTDGRCSHCSVKAITAADEMLVCPRCFALLRHQDYTAELRRKQELMNQRMAETRERNRQADAERKRRREEVRAEERRVREGREPAPMQDGESDDATQ